MNRIENNNHHPILEGAAIMGTVYGTASAINGVKLLRNVENARKVIGTKDTFDKDMFTKVSTNFVKKESTYSIKDVKRLTVTFAEDVKPTFEVVTEALDKAKEAVKKGMPKHIAKWAGIGIACGAAIGLLNKIACDRENKI